ncbi:MAG: ABC transporter permease subunit [Planctomycetes bacterium]|nr:ABC transporter permease subunit [Planctomycetota bacterium]
MTSLPAQGHTVGVDARTRSDASRRAADKGFWLLCLAVTTLASIILAVLVVAVMVQGWKYLSWDFLSNYASRFPEQAGFKAALWGSVWVCAVCAVTAVPLGVGTAVFLEEYGPKSGPARKLHEFVQLNISNLAGVPSVVYGIIGLTAFARMFGLFGPANISNYDDMIFLTLKDSTRVVGPSLGEDDTSIVIDDIRSGERVVSLSDIDSRKDRYVLTHTFTLQDGTRVEGRLTGSSPKSLRVFTGSAGGVVDVPREKIAGYDYRAMIEIGSRGTPFYVHLPFGGGVMAAGLTLMLVVLPIVIVSTREALRAVPASLREGARALGATRWQMVSRMILPAALPGVMTGAILAMSRAIGEAAPILVVSGIVFIMNTPSGLTSDFSAMPLQIFSWANMPQEEFKGVAAAGILVLLAVLACFNIAAVVIRQRLQKGLTA